MKFNRINFNIRKVFKKLLFRSYDYSFIKSKFKKIEKKENKEEIIVVGLSYSLFGINDKLLKYNSVNLSLPSQDFYYASKIAKRVIQLNKNIRYCIIGSSYYGLHFDLSSSKNENYRIKEVYYPILGDLHNLNRYKTKNKFLNFNLIAMFSNSYFNYFRTRNSMGLIRNKLTKLDENELKKVGEMRASMHNKLINYNNTVIENIDILDNLLTELQKNKIKPIIVIFPATKYYRHYMIEDFKALFYEKINSLRNKYQFELIDVYDSNEFFLDDYIDADHLNKKGSNKMTNIINNYI